MRFPRQEDWDELLAIPPAWGILDLSKIRPLITPADAAQIALFAPYCGGLPQEQALLKVLPLLHQGLLEGHRQLAGGKAHAFRLSWDPVRAPLSACHCELSFPNEPSLRYSFEVPAHQLVQWLMECPMEVDTVDLPERCWHWILLEQDPLVSDAG